MLTPVFKIDENTLTWGDILDLEEKGTTDKRLMTRIVSRCLVSLNGTPLTPEEAEAALRGMTLTQVNQIFTAFGEAMAANRNSAAPPPNSGGSDAP